MATTGAVSVTAAAAVGVAVAADVSGAGAAALGDVAASLTDAPPAGFAASLSRLATLLLPLVRRCGGITASGSLLLVPLQLLLLQSAVGVPAGVADDATAAASASGSAGVAAASAGVAAGCLVGALLALVACVLSASEFIVTIFEESDEESVDIAFFPRALAIYKRSAGCSNRK